MNVRAEEMLSIRWMSTYGGLIPLDEETVKHAALAFNTGYKSETEEHKTRHVRFSNHLRTAALFAIDPLDLPLDMLTISNYGDLPPLPFSRMWFEFYDVTSGFPLRPLRFQDLDGHWTRIAGLGIAVVAQSAEWRVYYMLDDEVHQHMDYPARCSIREFALLPGPSFGMGPQEEVKIDAEGERYWQSVMYGLPLGLIHYVSILGARFDEAPVLRARRREFERQTQEKYPTIYTVNLHGAGDVGLGHGDREYHYRWIVRGHYRREENGEYTVPGKGRCGWVRPHVKGPAGKPWKGRPIHVG